MAELNLRKRTIQDPPLAEKLFNNVWAALLWLPLRIWLGYKWLDAGLHKINSPAWMETGVALKGFWTGAVAIPAEGRPPIAIDWYRDFIQMMLDAGAYTWFAKLVVIGEIAIGVLLIVGAFTGIAAFLGGFMNWNFIMAGSASTNGLMFAVAVGLILAWKVAGYIGLDYFLLSWIGTPWRARNEVQSADHSFAPAPAGDK